MASEDDGDILERLYDYHLALVANSGLSEDSFKSTQESAKDNFADIVAAKRPWLGNTKEDRLGNEISNYKKDWQEIFGWDLDDPKAYKVWQEEASRSAKEEGERIESEAQEEIDKVTRMKEAQERVKERRRLANQR
jgi:hypothetical protein